MVGLLPRLVKGTEQRLVEDDFHESTALARHCVQRLVAFTLRLITPLFHDFGVELDVGKRCAKFVRRLRDEFCLVSRFSPGVPREEEQSRAAAYKRQDEQRHQAPADEPDGARVGDVRLLGRKAIRHLLHAQLESHDSARPSPL